MNFYELEDIMAERGISSLAEIARKLDTTPQAVSNWKARNQVPFHIVDKVKNFNNSKQINTGKTIYSNEDIISISDVFISLAEQLKVILFAPIVTTFVLLTYTNYIELPKYQSEAKLLLPKSSTGNSNGGGLSGIASQFGINVSNTIQADLSSPSLIPEILKSRKFAEIILSKEFFTQKYSKKLTLLQIIHEKENINKKHLESLTTSAMIQLEDMIEFGSTKGAFKSIKIITNEPKFSQELGYVVLEEMEKLNRFFKSQNTSEKIDFINGRINAVTSDLKTSEVKLKEFNEENQQISSPALELQLERLSRDVEVQKGIYLTLKQELELAKIDAIQENSIIQILDYPHYPIFAINKNNLKTIILGVFIGLILGIFIALLRSQINNSDIQGRKKIRRIKNFVKKKGKDFIYDTRISGTLILLLILFSPFYLGFTSQKINVFSIKFILNNLFYITITSALISYYLILKRKSR